MIFCVQVKNKPWLRYTTVRHLISWIHTRGSETILYFRTDVSVEGKIPLSLKPSRNYKRIFFFFISKVLAKLKEYSPV